MEAKEFLKIYVSDLTKRITPNDVVWLLEEFARQVSKEKDEKILTLVKQKRFLEETLAKGSKAIIEPKRKRVIKLADAIPIHHPVMYDLFMYKGREYRVWVLPGYPKGTYVEGRSVKIDGKQQTVRAKIDDCEWLIKKRK